MRWIFEALDWFAALLVLGMVLGAARLGWSIFAACIHALGAPA